MRYAAFLRAVNLGRNRRVTSAELCEIFEGVGAEEVATFRTSGNVVFEAPRDMTAEIEKALESALGYDVGVFTRTARELTEIAESAAVQAGPGGGVEGQAPGLDAVREAVGREAQAGARARHGRGPAGLRQARALLAAERRHARVRARPKTIDKLLGPTTMRTKGTVEQLTAKFFA